MIKNKYLLALLILSIALCANATVPQIEREALVAIYNSTNGDQWYNNSRWLDGDPCDNHWAGILCEDKIIIEMVFFQNKLAGSLPPEIGNLSNLLVLLIESKTKNSLGNIPPEIGLLVSLKKLLFYNAGFEGEIPTELGKLSNLEELVLDRNGFSGSIPKQFSNLVSLKKLHLNGINLSGTIPLEFSMLPELRELWLNYNQLTGNIPDELANLSNLESLKLNNNQLSSSIPITIGNLTKLTHLDLRGNQLTGNLPKELGNLTKINSMILGGNHFDGTIPPELSKLLNLVYLDLESNHFIGSFPPELMNLKKLQTLVITANQFTGNIPIKPDSASMSQLKSLHLGYNLFTGNIPRGLGNLNNLKILDLEGNRLTGTIPPQLGNLTNLTDFYIGYNQITGQIPVEITNLQMLSSFYASVNGLSGAIPIEFLGMSNLTRMDIPVNALYTDNETLSEFIDDKCNCDWSISQTVAPKNIQVFSHSGTSISITWDAIDYQLNGGGYQILMSTIEDDSYNLISETIAKTVTAHTIGELVPNQDYFFKIRSFTDPIIPFQQNIVASNDSLTIMATTRNESHSKVDLWSAITSNSVDEFFQVNDPVEYKIIIGNNDSNIAIDAGFRHVVPAGLRNVSWTCGNSTNGAVCPDISGSDDVDILVSLPANSSIELTFSGNINSNFSRADHLLLTSTILSPDGVIDSNLNNNINFLNLRNVLFKSGFE